MFRHTFATRQLQEGVSYQSFSKLLEHAGISTAFNIYAQVPDEHPKQFERQRTKVLRILPTIHME